MTHEDRGNFNEADADFEGHLNPDEEQAVRFASIKKVFDKSEVPEEVEGSLEYQSALEEIDTLASVIKGVEEGGEYPKDFEARVNKLNESIELLFPTENTAQEYDE